MARCGLKASAAARAREFGRELFPGWEVAAAPGQGFCSYTLLLESGAWTRAGSDGGTGSQSSHDGGGSGGGGAGGSSAEGSQDDTGRSSEGSGDGMGRGGNGRRLIQFRPRRHGIDVRICGEARRVFGSGVVPDVQDLGVLGGLETLDGRNDGELCVYAMERVGGVSLAEFRKVAGDEGRRAGRRRVVADLAVLFGDSWRGRRDRDEVSEGRVGGSIAWRLGVLEGLPWEFGEVVRGLKKDLREIEGLPWVVTHGDLVAGNIMVYPGGKRARDRDGGVVGVVDWAEAEWLPFGVGMYGLEEVLGEDVVVDDDDRGTRTRFEYYPEAKGLRALFWDEVGRVVADEAAVRLAKRAQVLGVLLWRGIAFDDGALGRVVDEERDWWDSQRLRVWLFGEGGLGLEHPRRRRWWGSRAFRRVGRCCL
ncbi:hypothetical protein CCHL11_03474 [Colletotrichum chlorophyti]|uniref:Aminoglycoside phosphotransferase domain-containing protein n=1 Tax=Colletotrichum chlorophyti TaxID=708187 RepID=A0A1Q8S099_9PEZI|nr:hypothetical protein CCHL11_03474 [Colletotrichum chlorophyti]